jgi:hypothetical protein
MVNLPCTAMIRTGDLALKDGFISPQKVMNLSISVMQQRFLN